MKWFALPLLPLILLSGFNASAAKRIFPGTEWSVAEPSKLGIDSAGLKAFENFAFTDTDLWRTDSVVVIYKGQLVFERYANGYNAGMRHLSWSMAKSFTTIIFGIAADKKMISGSDRLSDFYGDVATSPDHLARMQNVAMFNELNMNSGRDWVEDYTTSGALDSTIVQMNYLSGHKDMAAYAASQPLVLAPGAKFLYSTGSTNIVMGALKKRLGPAYATFAQANLFDRIGMTNVTWERDQSGTLSGGTSLYVTPRDFARFGYLLLNDGRWNGQQIVSKQWIDYIRTVSPGLSSGTVVPEKSVRNHRVYGAGFWLNTPVPRFGIPKPYADVPGDAFFAHGHEGQLIFVVPSLDLVVVRTAHDNANKIEADSRLDINSFLKPLLQALPNYKYDGSVPPPAIQPPEGEGLFAKLSLIGRWGSVSDLLSAQRAKDYCSCYYVVGQSPAYCEEWIKHGIPLFLGRPSVHQPTRSVTVNNRRAYFLNQEMGCQLQ